MYSEYGFQGSDFKCVVVGTMACVYLDESLVACTAREHLTHKRLVSFFAQLQKRREINNMMHKSTSCTRKENE